MVDQSRVSASITRSGFQNLLLLEVHLGPQQEHFTWTALSPVPSMQTTRPDSQSSLTHATHDLKSAREGAEGSNREEPW